MGKRIITVIASFILVITVSFTAFSSENDTLDSIKASVEGVISYKCKALNVLSTDEMFNELSKNAGDFSADWYYIALSRYGVVCSNENSIIALKNTVDKFYEDGLEKVKVTDMHRVALALLACNQDITNISGHNLLADSTYCRPNYKPLDSQGVNSLAYALLLLDSNNYNVPENAPATRKKIISDILDKELKNGGYSLFGNRADIDVTSIVLQALSPYKTQKNVKETINRCLSIISKRQDECGAFKSFSNQPAAETTAQVIIAVTSLGINPVNDSRFIKNGNTLIDGLKLFELDSGGYCHILGYSVNNIATYQSLCALVSVYRFLKGKKSFFVFNETNTSNSVNVNKAIRKSINKKVKNTSSKIEKSTNALETKEKNSSYSGSKSEKITVKKQKIHKKKQLYKKNTVISDTQSVEIINAKRKPFDKKTKEDKKSPVTPLFFCSIILLAGYIVLFIKKSGGK